MKGNWVSVAFDTGSYLVSQMTEDRKERAYLICEWNLARVSACNLRRVRGRQREQ